jgi:hypothetical protein
MTKIIRLTESDLVNLVKKVMNEQEKDPASGDAAVQIDGICHKCSLNSQIKITQRSNELADKINDAIDGPGTDFDSLVTWLKSIQNYTELCAVCKSYESSYGETLADAIDSDVDFWDLTTIYRIMRDLTTRR